MKQMGESAEDEAIINNKITVAQDALNKRFEEEVRKPAELRMKETDT